MKNKILAIITIVMAIAVVGLGVVMVGAAGNNDKEPATTQPIVITEPEEAEEPEEPKEPEEPSELQATLFFASDYQEGEQGTPADNLKGILNAVKEDKPKLDGTVFCGDYSNVSGKDNFQITPEPAISEIETILKDAYPDLENDDMIFTQGNHDPLTISINAPGIHEFDDYIVYVNNTEIDFPWMQGKTSGCLYKVKHTAEVMKIRFNKMIEAGEKRPIIVAQHVPLHFTARTSSENGTGDNLYSSIVFDVVNEAAKDLNIIYVTGHNHSNGWDNYMGGSCYFKKPGDTILIPEFDSNKTTTDSFTKETLNFTYLNAGYTGYCKSDAADNTLTGTVCEIYDNKFEFTKYSSEGVHPLSAAGAACSDPSDTDMISSENYSKEIDSPQKVERK